MAPRAERTVVPVLCGDGGEVLGARPVVVHPALGPECEVGSGKDRRVDPVAARAPPGSPAPGHVGHLVEPQGHRHLRPAPRPGPAPYRGDRCACRTGPSRRRRRPPRRSSHPGRRARVSGDAVGGAEPEDHDLGAIPVLAQGLEVELDLHADAEVAAPADEDALHPRALGQVDLRHPVGADLGVALGEQGHVDIGPGVDAACRAEEDVDAALGQAQGADEAAGEEVLAALRAAAAEQAWRLAGVVRDREVAVLDRAADGSAGCPGSHTLLLTVVSSPIGIGLRSGSLRVRGGGRWDTWASSGWATSVGRSPPTWWPTATPSPSATPIRPGPQPSTGPGPSATLPQLLRPARSPSRRCRAPSRWPAAVRCSTSWAAPPSTSARSALAPP